MRHNPRKRVTSITVGRGSGDARIVLEINGARAVFIETQGVTAEQAEILCKGYINGLQWGENLPPEIIEMLVNDPLEMAALPVPLTICPADRGLFKRGTASALALASDGYWLDSRKGVPADRGSFIGSSAVSAPSSSSDFRLSAQFTAAGAAAGTASVMSILAPEEVPAKEVAPDVRATAVGT